jgi:mRNA-degrading endonuclease RelE of RelBE toxin-antitoxin system
LTFIESGVKDFTPAAVRQWLKLSRDIRKRIDTKLTVYATNGSAM